MSIHSTITKSMQANQKLFAVLIDPDDTSTKNISRLVELAEKAGVDFFFIGGSLMTKTNFSSVIHELKQNTEIPLVIFPGSIFQIDGEADALLFLSLISGRNPDFLIGQHVHAAPHLKKSSLEIISTGYMLIDGGNTSTAQYISNTTPIPGDKTDIAVSTAIAGELIGQRLIYMDAGSGARNPVAPEMISAVKKHTDIPLITGGGIKTTEQARQACKAGADVIVVGNAIEKSPELIQSFSGVVKSF